MVMMSFNGSAQNTRYEISKDEKSGDLVYNGPITFEDLNGEPTFTWLKSGMDEYKPEERYTEHLRGHLKDYKMVIFMGTWCDDSHYLIPKLEKVLLTIGYPLIQLTMYGVDRAKKTKDNSNERSKITLVPTIILFRDDKEVGRITETVQRTVESDLSAIIEKDMVTADHK